MTKQIVLLLLLLVFALCSFSVIGAETKEKTDNTKAKPKKSKSKKSKKSKKKGKGKETQGEPKPKLKSMNFESIWSRQIRRSCLIKTSAEDSPLQGIQEDGKLDVCKELEMQTKARFKQTAELLKMFQGGGLNFKTYDPLGGGFKSSPKGGVSAVKKSLKEPSKSKGLIAMNSTIHAAFDLLAERKAYNPEEHARRVAAVQAIVDKENEEAEKKKKEEEEKEKVERAKVVAEAEAKGEDPPEEKSKPYKPEPPKTDNAKLLEELQEKDKVLQGNNSGLFKYAVETHFKDWLFSQMNTGGFGGLSSNYDLESLLGGKGGKKMDKYLKKKVKKDPAFVRAFKESKRQDGEFGDPIKFSTGQKDLEEARIKREAARAEREAKWERKKAERKRKKEEEAREKAEEEAAKFEEETDETIVLDMEDDDGEEMVIGEDDEDEEVIVFHDDL